MSKTTRFEVTVKKTGTHIDSTVRFFTVIKLAALNDRNGNPRRCWVIINSTPDEVSPVTFGGNIVTAIDCGYDDSKNQVEAFFKPLRKYHDIAYVMGPTFNVSASEYAQTLKQHKTLGQLRNSDGKTVKDVMEGK